MDQKLLNKIQMIDKVAQDLSIYSLKKEAFIMTPAVLAVLMLGSTAVGAAAEYAWLNQATPEQKKKEYLKLGKQKIKNDAWSTYRSYLPYAQTEADYQKNKQSGLIKGNSPNREAYIMSLYTDESLADKIKRDEGVKKAVEERYFTQQDVNDLIAYAKKVRGDILEDLRSGNQGSVKPSSSLSRVDNAYSPFSKLSKDELSAAERLAVKFTNDIINNVQSDKQGTLDKKVSFLNGQIKSSKTLSDNTNLPLQQRYEKFRVSQILSAFLNKINPPTPKPTGVQILPG
jgi:hypothetical protein